MDKIRRAELLLSLLNCPCARISPDERKISLALTFLIKFARKRICASTCPSAQGLSMRPLPALFIAARAVILTIGSTPGPCNLGF